MKTPDILCPACRWRPGAGALWSCLPGETISFDSFPGGEARRGYYERVPDIAARLFGLGERMQVTQPHPHGLLGPVRLVRERS